MNTIVILSALLLGSAFVARASDGAPEDPELDPNDVEEPGCPKIHNLAPIDHFKEVRHWKYSLNCCPT
jgi:hypothetical protein